MQHIRGVAVTNVMKDNTIRIPRSSTDKIAMSAHCARHELHLGNHDTLLMDDLIERLRMSEYCSDSTYRDVLTKNCALP